MPRLIATTREGQEVTVEGGGGRSVMEVLRESGVGDILALCGGCCSCATCHVYVAPEFLERLPPMSADERDLLDSSAHRLGNSRLACQIPFAAELDGLAIRVAPED